jgi:hypothetical protein
MHCINSGRNIGVHCTSYLSTINQKDVAGVQANVPVSVGKLIIMIQSQEEQ